MIGWSWRLFIFRWGYWNAKESDSERDRGGAKREMSGQRRNETRMNPFFFLFTRESTRVAMKQAADDTADSRVSSHFSFLLCAHYVSNRKFWIFENSHRISLTGVAKGPDNKSVSVLCIHTICVCIHPINGSFALKCVKLPVRVWFGVKAVGNSIRTGACPMPIHRCATHFDPRVLSSDWR